MNKGPIWGRFMKKTRGQKSLATVPLKINFHEIFDIWFKKNQKYPTLVPWLKASICTEYNFLAEVFKFEPNSQYDQNLLKQLFVNLHGRDGLIFQCSWTFFYVSLITTNFRRDTEVLYCHNTIPTLNSTAGGLGSLVPFLPDPHEGGGGGVAEQWTKQLYSRTYGEQA